MKITTHVGETVRSWKINRPGEIFCLADVYRLLPDPADPKKQASCRCKLERLRDREGLEFLGKGTFRWPATLRMKSMLDKTKPAPNAVSVEKLAENHKLEAVARNTRQKDHRELRYIRPSEFVANVADPNNPGKGYQRDPFDRAPTLKKIANAFKPDLLGTWDAWINADGKPELLDALGRCAVCRFFVKPAYDEPVATNIHTDVHDEAAAALRFEELNRDKANVNKKNKYFSALAQGDSDTWELQTAAKKGGLSIGGSGKNRISVQAAETLHALGVLTEVGLIKGRCWPDYQVNNTVFIGLGAYLKATRDNSETLRQVLESKGPTTVYAAAVNNCGGHTHARKTTPHIALQILKLRNKSRSANRVTPNWSVVNRLLADSIDRWAPITDEH